jgi:hypothetical protein
MSVVVLAVEATLPARSMSQPSLRVDSLVAEWMPVISEAGGEVWEHGDASFLVCWVAQAGLKTALKEAVGVALRLRESAQMAGYRLSAGLAPGAAQLSVKSHRPAIGWELAGPFYLARWMMNLSAHRGRIVLTGVGQKQVVEHETTPLGRISIQGNQFIQLFELS